MMNRREFLKAGAALSAGAALPGCTHFSEGQRDAAIPRWNRPGEAGWPSESEWAELRAQVGGRLLAIESPVEKCRNAPGSRESDELFRKLKNPYYIGDHPALTQTSGWIDGWTSSPSVYAVAAKGPEDVAAAVNFAREHNVRLVVKGGGHSYLGTSNAPDSLLLWTRRLNQIELRSDFVPQGCAGAVPAQPAVTLGAGTIWGEAYHAVTVEGGRYVQGGGCTTVGVAGLIQSGGFGSFSKRYGMAAAGLIEAKVVTADGAIRIVNARMHPDLFWALKGGGGGSLGIITELTLRTRDLPNYFGAVFGTIKANSDRAYRRLIEHMLVFYRERLFNPHWGEQVRFDSRNTLTLSLVFQGLDQNEAMRMWQPFVEWVRSTPADFTIERPVGAIHIAARDFWNPRILQTVAPGAILRDDRPEAPSGRFFWGGDHGQAGWVIHGYQSAWLPASLLAPREASGLAAALFEATRHWPVSLHFNKGLAGASDEEIAAARDTATNPAVLNAFALAIIATGEGPAFPGIPGHEPNLPRGREHARAIRAAMDELRKVAPEPASYVSETDFFQESWQQSFWGSNYPKLAAIKAKYDPGALFTVHHGVGSELLKRKF